MNRRRTYEEPERSSLVDGDVEGGEGSGVVSNSHEAGVGTTGSSKARSGEGRLGNSVVLLVAVGIRSRDQRINRKYYH